MCPDILNILSTDADEAGTLKNFLFLTGVKNIVDNNINYKYYLEFF